MFTWWPLSNEMAGGFVIGLACLGTIYAVSLWAWNNGQPVRTQAARVVSRRVDFGTAETSEAYYATFEMDGGNRQGFGLSEQEYGLLTEGDSGTLTYQGTRYKGFARSA